MSICYNCGQEIEFAYVDGALTPMHVNGSCNSGYGGGVVIRSSSIQRPAFPYESFVNPNASCPVCGERVYFYQSQYGGRVFFNELGPPWPKHPCTDNSRVSSRRPIPRPYQWELDGWQPFTLTETPIDLNGITKIVGKVGKDQQPLTLKVLGVSRHFRCSPILIKELQPAKKDHPSIRKFRVALLEVENGTANKERYFEGFCDVSGNA